MRSAGRHLGTYLQLTDLRTGSEMHEVRSVLEALLIGGTCLAPQIELEGDGPTDVTGSPRSAQKSLRPGSGRDCSLPNKLAAMRFFAIAPLCLRGTVPVQTGLPRAFEWY